MIVCSCTNQKIHVSSLYDPAICQITGIDSIHNWYIIYAKKTDGNCKIVVEKAQQKPQNGKQKIVVGNSYTLLVFSRRKHPPVINGIEVAPQNFLDVPCQTYDDSTQICIEPHSGYYELYTTISLKGLWYIAG